MGVEAALLRSEVLAGQKLVHDLLITTCINTYHSPLNRHPNVKDPGRRQVVVQGIGFSSHESFDMM